MKLVIAALFVLVCGCSHPAMRGAPAASTAAVQDSELAGDVALALHEAAIPRREDLWIVVRAGEVRIENAPADAASRERLLAVVRAVPGVRSVELSAGGDA